MSPLEEFKKKYGPKKGDSRVMREFKQKIVDIFEFHYERAKADPYFFMRKKYET